MKRSHDIGNETKSWILLDYKAPEEDDDRPPNGVVEVKEPGHESDSDSFSIISECGSNTGKSDDEELPPLSSPEPLPDLEEIDEITDEIHDIRAIMEVPPIVENTNPETNILTLATSAVVIVIVSLALQLYLQPPNAMDDFNEEFEQDNDLPSYCIQSFSKDDYIESHDVQQCINKFEEKSNERKRKYQIRIIDSEPHKIRKTEDNERINFVTNSEENFQSPEDISNEQAYDTVKTLEELKAKEKYLRQKEEFLIKKEHDLIKKEIKINSQREYCGMKKKTEKEPEFQQKMKNQKEEISGKKSEKPEEYRRNEKNRKQGKEMKRKQHKDGDKENKKKWETKSEHKKGETYEKHFKAKSHKLKEERRKFTMVSGDQDTGKPNITGQWYSNLHKARNDMRKKEQVSDWLFERAHFRSSKRNKAHWYFQWMLDRERLRLK